ncbi:hypothetical protein [Hymenobacter sediminicola]|uniref:DUF4884 domain-containing protein n=1 Tax=Hymenobacter sediminicola TaxID=2761579 RepID=A0A7G7WC92_9BACT|nr:hypothetical protein [Hymenobacter sediminicola]QNH63985.1 hypothetical protein H4317_09400 [Hymenobacter sediminicola]
MKHICIFLLALALAGCTDASQARLDSYGSTFKVEVVSGGQIIRTYTSTGKVGNSRNAYYFNDAATGKFTEVSGSVIITQID